jgi:large subunit ribosomal protein L32e
MMKKKKHTKFNIPNYGTRSRKRVKERWRKQRGIDNKKRVKIGYRNPAQLRGTRCDGARAMLVHNMKELQALIEAKGTQEVVATIAKRVATRKRIEMTKLAAQHSLRVTNGVYR